MKLRYLLSIATLALIFTASVTLQTGCASIVPPLGGPRDSLPPVLLNATPGDSTLHFSAKKFTLTFSEFVQIEDIQKNLIITPTPKINPIINTRLKVVTVNIRDTLDANTTYTFNFGNAIKDVNEGNVLRNFKYVLSTGNYLDSLTLGGKVILAQTGKADSTLLVMLYKDRTDSAVVKDKPRYIARVDSSGNFHFSNLPPDTFAIYAWKDEGARRYLSKKQMFAFADSAITSQSEKKDILLYAFEEKDTTKPFTSADKQAAKPSRVQADSALKFRTNLSGNQLDLLDSLELTFDAAPLTEFDSTKARLTTDSFQVIKGYSWLRDTSNKKLTLVFPWVEATGYHLLLDPGFAMDSSGRKTTKEDTVNIQTRRESEYGLVRLRFLGLQLNNNPLLQFIQSDQVKFSYPFKNNNQFYARLFAPGEYELRLVYDTNKNGEWDTGNFFGKHLQPEKVQSVNRRITVKANWDNEVDIQLAPPPTRANGR